MHKHLQGHPGLAADRTDLVERQFAGQHDPFHAQSLGHIDALGARQGHLRRGVDRQLGAHGPHQLQHAQVLDQHGVDAQFGQRADRLFDLRQLARKGQRIDGHVTAHPALMQQGQHVGQFFEGEIDGPVPRVKADLQTKINGVRAVFDRSPNAIAVPGGS